jgi:hypothetical protein
VTLASEDEIIHALYQRIRVLKTEALVGDFFPTRIPRKLYPRQPEYLSVLPQTQAQDALVRFVRA